MADVQEEWNGLIKGTPIKIKGERGEFRFHAYHNDGHYVDAWGPINGAKQGMRSFTADRVIRKRRRK